MKIVIIAGPYYPVPPTKYGGTERVIYYLIKGLKELGHEPILLGPADSQVDCRVIPIVDRSIAFPKKDSPAFRRQVTAVLAETARQLRKVAPSVDIIHSHDFDLSSFQQFPNLTTMHGHIGFETLPYYQLHERLPFVSISKDQQATYPGLNWLGVAYNGLDPAEFPLITKPADYLCFIGRFDWDKSPHLAIQLALSTATKLKLAGKLDLGGADYFKKEIKPYLKHPLIDYLGEVDMAQKIELVGRARANLHPLLGRREPFGLTVIEAAYLGTPTMAMNKASMPELIEHGQSGWLVEDFVEGSHYLDKLYALDRRYVSRRARHRFNYRLMTKQYLRAYRRAIREFAKKR